VPESFGARMRQRREDQQIALVKIAEQTKIKQSLLEALERDDVSHWPTGIFRKAFIRSYALAIGLDADAVVREFFDIFPEPVEVVTTAALAAATDAARGTGGNGGGPSTRFRSFFGSFSMFRRHAPAEESPEEHVALREPAPPEPEFETILVDEVPRQPSPPPPGPDFMLVAQLCTEFARVDNAADVRPLLRQAALILNANGVVVWVWDPGMSELRPALAAGYSEVALAQLPNVRPDADNVTAHAYRSGQACSIDGVERSALVVPLLTPTGCAGVLAFELHGNTLTKAVRAAATIIAAQLSQLLGVTQPAEAQVALGDAHVLRAVSA
jgi:transcriptional regulator with XRE-family HTH domain